MAAALNGNVGVWDKNLPDGITTERLDALESQLRVIDPARLNIVDTVAKIQNLIAQYRQDPSLLSEQALQQIEDSITRIANTYDKSSELNAQIVKLQEEKTNLKVEPVDIHDLDGARLVRNYLTELLKLANSPLQPVIADYINKVAEVDQQFNLNKLLQEPFAETGDLEPQVETRVQNWLATHKQSLIDYVENIHRPIRENLASIVTTSIPASDRVGQLISEYVDYDTAINNLTNESITELGFRIGDVRTLFIPENDTQSNQLQPLYDFLYKVELLLGAADQNFRVGEGGLNYMVSELSALEAEVERVQSNMPEPFDSLRTAPSWIQLHSLLTKIKLEVIPSVREAVIKHADDPVAQEFSELFTNINQSPLLRAFVVTLVPANTSWSDHVRSLIDKAKQHDTQAITDLQQLLAKINEIKNEIPKYLAVSGTALENLERDLQPENNFALVQILVRQVLDINDKDIKSKQRSLISSTLSELEPQQLPLARAAFAEATQLGDKVKAIESGVKLVQTATPQLAEITKQLEQAEVTGDGELLLELQVSLTAFTQEFEIILSVGELSWLVPQIAQLQDLYQRTLLTLTTKLVDFISANTAKLQKQSGDELATVQTTLAELRQTNERDAEAMMQKLNGLLTGVDMLIARYVIATQSVELSPNLSPDATQVETAGHILYRLNQHLPNILLMIQNANRDHLQLLELQNQEQQEMADQAAIKACMEMFKAVDKLVPDLQSDVLEKYIASLRVAAAENALSLNSTAERVVVLEKAVADVLESIARFKSYDTDIMHSTNDLVFNKAQNVAQIIRILNLVGQRQIFRIKVLKVGEVATDLTGSDVARKVTRFIELPVGERTRQSLVNSQISRAFGLRQKIIDEYNIRV